MGRRKDWLKTDGIISFVKRVQVSNFYEQAEVNLQQTWVELRMVKI